MLDTILLPTLALTAIALVLGSMRLRNQGGVNWTWAWAAILGAAVCWIASDRVPELRYGAVVLSSMFPFLLYRGGLLYRYDEAPLWPVFAGIAFGFLRVGLSLVGETTTQLAAAVVDPLLIGAAAWHVHKAAEVRGRSTVRSLLAPSLLVVGLVDGLDAGLTALATPWAPIGMAWVAACLAALGLQIVARLEDAREEGARAEDSLRESLRRFDVIAAGAYDMIFEFDDTGVLHYASPGVRDALGYVPEDLLGTRLADIIHPDDLPDVILPEQILSEGGSLRRLQGRVRHASGGWHALESTAHTYRTASGETRVVVISRDVSDEHAAREERRVSEERFNRVVQDTNALITEIDPEGRLTYVSPNYHDVLGRGPEEFLGKTMEEVAVMIESSRLDDLRERGTGIDVYLDNNRGEISRLRHADGSWRWTESDVSTYRAANGEIRAMIVSRDVTKREQVLEELRASEERMRAIVASLGWNQIVLIDRHGVISSVLGEPEPQRTYGMVKEDIPGRHIRDFVDEERAQELLLLIDRVFEAGEPGQVRSQVTLPVGLCHFDVSLRPVRSASGDVDYALAVVSDVTEQVNSEAERRRLEAQMQQTQKLESLGVLASGIAHDVNNILTGVLANAEVALNEMAPEDPARAPVQAAAEAAVVLAEMTSELLAFSGKGSEERAAVDVEKLVRDTANILQSSLPPRVGLEFEADSGLPAVEADVSQLRQVVMNLILNAAEATDGEGGSVSVTLRSVEVEEAPLDLALGEVEPGPHVRLEIADQGRGMDAATRARIFDPFYTTKPGGRGLGLAAASGIIRAHRGAMSVSSALGEGTTFRLLLPASERLVKKPAAPREEKPAGRGRILVVDDQELVIKAAAAILKDRGYEVIRASSGEEGVQRFEQRPDEIDLVLLDATMPGLGGPEAFKQMRKIRPEVPVVVMSGFNPDEVQGRFQGAVGGYLKKPFLPDGLASLIASVLRDA